MIASIKKFFEQHLAPEGSTGRGHSARQLQLATAALLVEMTRVDHEVQAQELDTVTDAIRASFGLSYEETAELMALAEQEADQMTSYFAFTSLINKAYSQEEKVKLIELMWQVALSDGRLDKYEEHLIRKVANLIYVPRQEIVAAKHRALRARQAKG